MSRCGSISPAPNLPALRRKNLEAGDPPEVTTESGSIAEGVEFFHIQFGIDTTGDGTANYYTSNASGGKLTDILAGQYPVSARIFVLIRSREPVGEYTDDKVYQLGDITLCTTAAGATCTISLNDIYADLTPAVPVNKFYRRVYTTTVQIRNRAYTSQMNKAEI